MPAVKKSKTGQDNFPLSTFSPAIFIEIAPNGAVMTIANTASIRIISPAEYGNDIPGVFDLEWGLIRSEWYFLFVNTMLITSFYRFCDTIIRNVFLQSSSSGWYFNMFTRKLVNLQTAIIIINVDLPWNPAVLEQRAGLINRPGQKKKINSRRG